MHIFLFFVIFQEFVGKTISWDPPLCEMHSVATDNTRATDSEDYLNFEGSQSASPSAGDVRSSLLNSCSRLTTITDEHMVKSEVFSYSKETTQG